MNKSIRLKGLKAELDYCQQKIIEGHKSEHWMIRQKEITTELKKLKRKKK